VLRGWKEAVYLACDQAQTLDHLFHLAEVQQAGASEKALRTFLNRCVHHQLMVHNEHSWLGVAVRRPAREDP
jgi:hypothetical protein